MPKNGNSSRLLSAKLVAFWLLSALLLGEVAVRCLGRYDADGNFSVGKTTLRPYVLATATAQKHIDAYLREEGRAKLKYDPVLGWSPAPCKVSEDGLYHYDHLGIRSADTLATYLPARQDSVFTIVVIGDSFAHCDEVAFQDAWPHLLEVALQKHGKKARVINLGVSGFGMDQALLRWKTLGRDFGPDLVIFAIQMENVRRNVNLLRSIYYPASQIAFSKPRFVLENGRLVPINLPTLPPRSVPLVMADFEHWPLAKQEYFYHPSDYRQTLFSKSKIWSLAREWAFPDTSLHLRPPVGIHSGRYPLEEEPAQIALHILEDFQKDVTEQGAKPMLVHLPHIWAMGHYRKYGNIPYDGLLDEMEKRFGMVETKDAFMARVGGHPNDVFFNHFHYSPLGNRVVAEVVEGAVLDVIRF